MKTQTALDDFLAEQDKISYLCILVQVKDDPNKVKLIRWIENRERCDYSQSVIVDKVTIDFLSPTEHFYFMGYKKYVVVEVVFKAGATISLTDFVDFAWQGKGYGRAKTVQEILDSL